MKHGYTECTKCKMILMKKIEKKKEEMKKSFIKLSFDDYTLKQMDNDALVGKMVDELKTGCRMAEKYGMFHEKDILYLNYRAECEDCGNLISYEKRVDVNTLT